MSSQGERVQKSTKNQKKSKKRTHMTGEELRLLRLEMKVGPCDMYRLLGLPRRTYQDYEAGRRSIPLEVAIKARAAHRRDREFMANLPAKIFAALDRQFPGGIIPAAAEKEDP